MKKDRTISLLSILALLLLLGAGKCGSEDRVGEDIQRVDDQLRKIHQDDESGGEGEDASGEGKKSADAASQGHCVHNPDYCAALAGAHCASNAFCYQPEGQACQYKSGESGYKRLESVCRESKRLSCSTIPGCTWEKKGKNTGSCTVIDICAENASKPGTPAEIAGIKVEKCYLAKGVKRGRKALIPNYCVPQDEDTCTFMPKDYSTEKAEAVCKTAQDQASCASAGGDDYLGLCVWEMAGSALGRDDDAVAN